MNGGVVVSAVVGREFDTFVGTVSYLIVSIFGVTVEPYFAEKPEGRYIREVAVGAFERQGSIFDVECDIICPGGRFEVVFFRRGKSAYGVCFAGFDGSYARNGGKAVGSDFVPRRA